MLPPCKACGDPARDRLHEDHGKLRKGDAVCRECRDELVSGKASPRITGLARRGSQHPREGRN